VQKEIGVHYRLSPCFIRGKILPSIGAAPTHDNWNPIPVRLSP
jgi:hypothetical protein